jgi:hypothetical protein
VERAIELLAVIQFLLLGFSHMLQPGAWVELFVWLREKGRAGVLAHGIMSLWFGSMVLAFHNVWSGLPAILTLLGCAYILKAFVCFLLPEIGLRSLRRVSQKRAWEFAVPGAFFVVMGGALSYSLWAN